MKNKGMTLVELLIASLLLLIVVGGVMTAYVNNIKMLTHNKKKEIALRYLNNEMEEFNSLTKRNDIIAKTNFPKTITYKDENENITNYKIETTYKDYFINNSNQNSGNLSTDPTLLRLSLTIKWDQNSMSKQFISNPGLN